MRVVQVVPKAVDSGSQCWAWSTRGLHVGGARVVVTHSLIRGHGASVAYTDVSGIVSP